MNAPHRIQPAVTYRAWKVISGPTLGKVSQPLGLIDADDFDHACEKLAINRGDVFHVLCEDSRTNRKTLRIVQIKKQSKPRRKWSTKANRFVEIGAEYPVTVAEFDVDAFAPTEPFDALRDDPTGHDATLVDGVI